MEGANASVSAKKPGILLTPCAVPQSISVLRKSVVAKLRNIEGSSNFARAWSTEQTPHFCIAGLWEA